MSDKYGDWQPVESAASQPRSDSKVGDWQPVKQDSGLMGATTDVINRGVIANTLGGPVDIANLALEGVDYGAKKLGYDTKLATKEPFLGSEYIGKKMQESGMVSPKRRPTAELIAGLAPSLVTGGVSGVRAGVKGISKLIGGGKDLAAELQASTAGKTAQEIAAAEKRAGTAESRAGTAQKIVEREAGKGETAYGQLPGVTTTTEAGATKAIPEAEATIGQRIKTKADEIYSKLKATRAANAEKNKTAAFNAAKTKEMGGAKVEDTQAYKDVMKEIKGMLNDPDTKLAVATLDPIKNPLLSIKRALDPRYVDEAGIVRGKPVSFQGMEDLRRFLRDRSYGLPAEGFDAINQQKAGKLADSIEKVMEEFSPGIKKFISQYRKDSEPLRVFQSKVGKAMTEEQLLGKGSNYAAVSSQDIPGRVFKNKENFNALVDAFGGDVKAARAEGQKYFSSKMEGINTAKAAKKFIADNRSMLQETGSYDMANKFAIALEKAEKRGAGAAEKGAARTKTAAEQRAIQGKLQIIQSDIERADKITNPKEKIDYINSQAKKLADYLPIEQRDQFLNEVQSVVNAEQKKLAIKKWTQIALGGAGLYTTGHIASGYLGK